MLDFEHALMSTERTSAALSRFPREWPTILSSLAAVDVDQIPTSQLTEAEDFWNASFASIREILASEKLPLDSPALLTVLRICRNACQFVRRRLENGSDNTRPLISLLGLNEKLAGERKLSFVLPTISQYARRCEFAELIVQRLELEPMSVDSILRIGLLLAMTELVERKRFRCWGVIEGLIPELSNLEDDVLEQLIELDDVDRVAEKIPEISNVMEFLVIRYVYEWQTGSRLARQVHCDDFYDRLMQKMFDSESVGKLDSILSAFVFVSGDPVSIPVEFEGARCDPKKLFAALALNDLIRGVKLNGKVPCPVSENIVMLAVKNNYRKVLERHIKETVDVAVYAMSRAVNVDPCVFCWVAESMKGDVNAARMLLDYPCCVDFLQPSRCRLHRVVEILVSKNVDLPSSANVSIAMAAAILRMRQLRMEPSKKYVMEVLHSAHKALKCITTKLCGNRMNRVHLTFAGLSWPNSGVRAVSLALKSPKDFVLSAADNSFESITLTIMTILPFVQKEIQEKEDTVCDILTDFSLHFALGKKLKKLIDAHFSDVFAKSKDNRRIYHIIRALEDASAMSETLDIISSMPMTDSALLEAVTSYIIRNVETCGIDVFMKFSETMLKGMNVSLKLDIFELLVSHKSVAAATEFACKLLKSLDKDLLSSIYSILGRYAIESSEVVLAVYKAIDVDNYARALIIEALPSFEGSMSQEFGDFLKLVLSELPSFSLMNHKKPIRKDIINSNWGEDGEPVATGPRSAWFDPSHEDVLPNSIYIPKVPGQAPTGTVSAAALTRLFVSLSRSSIVEAETRRESGVVDVASFQLSQMSAKISNPKCSLVPIGNNNKVMDPSAIARELKTTENKQKFARRIVISPYNVAVTSGPYLVVGDCMKLRSFSLSNFEQVGSIDVPFVPLQVLQSPLDPNVIAVSSMRRVIIYSLDNDGSFSVMNEIELMLDAIGPKLFVIAIHWVPLSPLHLAVVCNSFVKVYDVPSDCFAPIACFLPPQHSDSFTSAVFIEHDDDCIALFGLASGQIAIEHMSPEAERIGERRLRSLVKVPGIPIQPILSYAHESDLLFITAPGAMMKVARLDDILNVRKPPLNVALGSIPGELRFAGTLPENRAIHILVHTHSGSLVGLEVKSDLVNVFALSDDYPRAPGIPIMDEKATVMSTFETADHMWVIEKDGSVTVLRPGENASEEVIKPNITVPESFWSKSKVSTSSISVKAVNLRDVCRLHMGDELLLPAQENVIEVTSNDSGQLITGFRIVVGAHPPDAYVKLRGRRVHLSDEVFLPLKHTEVQPRATIKLEFVGAETVCKQIDVFCLSAASFAQMSFPETFNWRKNATGLYEFKDGHWRSGTEAHRLCSMCARAIVGDDSTIEADLVKALVKLIYTSPELSDMARSVLCRVAMERDRFSMLWAAAMKEVIETSEITSNEWNLIYRDYDLMPSCARQIVVGALWSDKAPETSRMGVDPLISAFI